MEGSKAQAGQEAPRRVSGGLVLLLELLLMLQLHLLLVAQLALESQAFELMGLVSTQHL